MERDTLLTARYHVVCARHCGFRVSEDYFSGKPRFAPGICPRCGSPCEVVKAFTEEVVPGAWIVTNPKDGRTLGKVVEDDRAG